MTERWKEIDRLFEAALERAPEDRARFLSEACEGYVELRREVEALLEASEQAGDFLESPAQTLAAALWGEVKEEEGRQGERIGRYRILGEIARGGMGTVYRAERDDGEYRQQVALKLLRRGLDTEEVLERFRAERQILASLTHPHIARLLDGGETEEGRPYLVMEYVEGQPIDRYCDEERLTIEQRLRLFQAVGRAVQSAHAALVVHRDLKPGNILVTDEGEVKLLDFGIAKLLDEAEGSRTGPRTRTGVWMMTPEYASPEQARGEAITTASDVYQMGLLLYQLLSGDRAYELRGCSPVEMERVVCGEEPPPMSARIDRRGRGEGVEETARARRMTPERLRRRLKGDLDAIAAKALRKEPEQRYASVEQMVEDIERFLEGLPVRAHKGSRSYRVRKFLARNRMEVVSGTVIVLLLATALAASFRYALATAEHLRLIAAERDRARIEARNADEVKDLLVGIFEEADPRRTLGRDVTVREVLERGLPRIETELSEQPEVQATLLGAIGGVHRHLRHDDLSESVLRQAVELWRKSGVGDHEEFASVLNSLGLVLVENGRYEEAEQLIQEALAMHERLFGRRHVETSVSTNNLALTLSNTDRLDEAVQLYRETLEIRTALLGDRNERVAVVMGNLGSLHQRRGELEEAEAMLRGSLAIREAVLPETHPNLSVSLVNLGHLLRRIGRYDEAEVLLRRGLEIDRRVFGPDHPEVAKDLINLGFLVRDRGRSRDAEPLLREALAIARLQPDDRPLIADAANVLGLTVADHGDYAEAERLHREALETKRELHGDMHPVVGISLYNLATVLQGLGRHADAAAALRRVVAIDSAAFGAEHPEVGVDLTKLAGVLAAAGRVGEADEMYQRALSILRAGLPSGHRRIANAVLEYGELLLEQGDVGRAEPLLREGLRIRRANLGEGSGKTAQAMSLLGAALLARGDLAGAVPLLESGYEGARSAWGDEDPRTHRAHGRLDILRKARAVDAPGR